MTRSGDIAALVPMRHHSVRVPGKNYRTLGGEPLYRHIVRTLLACPSIARIAIDTDSPIILDDCGRQFPSVQLIERPEALRADDVPMTEVLCHDMSLVTAETYLQTHSTNPFLTSATIERAIAFWRTQTQFHDSLFSVTRVQGRLWDALARPVNHNPWILLRTQDLPPTYLENSNFYLFRGGLLRTSRRRIGDRPALFEVNPLESLDIDDENSFKLAEAIIASRITT